MVLPTIGDDVDDDRSLAVDAEPNDERLQRQPSRWC